MLPETAPPSVDLIAEYLDSALGNATKRPFVLGLCGSQGSGKSTIVMELQKRFEARGCKVAVLSLDDLYLSREERQRLAAAHPLFATRGVPGTHDVVLGESVILGCGRRERVKLPRFSKQFDTPAPAAEWDQIDGPVDIILFEGWCVGAVAQPPEALARPVNALEQYEDQEGIWRSAVNDRLAGEYQRLFAYIDRLVLLAAPGFEIVSAWRKEQEHALRTRLKAEGKGLAATLDDAGIDRFVQHYQRITQHVLEEMPNRADLVIWLDRDRRPVRYHKRMIHEHGMPH